MKINRGREAGTTSELRTATFTGEVWADPVLAGDGRRADQQRLLRARRADALAHARPGPDPRRHERRGARPRARRQRRDDLAPGDVVWIPPGEEHWHGAAPDSYMLHLAISLGGHDWLDPVTDEEYEEGWA